MDRPAMRSCTAVRTLPGARPIFDVLACVEPDDIEDRDAESMSSAG